MRLIDADALKNLPFERMIHTDFGDTAIPIEEIDNAPTVELFCSYLSDGEVKEPCVEAPCKHERPQGEWLPNYTSQFINPGRQCSLCGKIVEFSENYCPRCGAYMRGKNNG